MPEPMPEPSGIPFLGRYLTVLVIVTVALTAIGWALFAFAGVALPPGAASIIPPMAGALHVGQHWGRTRGVVPASREAWRWALMAGLVYLALQLVLLPPMIASVGFGAELLGLIAVLVGGATAMSILLNRFFLVIGARSGVAGAKR